MTRKNIGEDSTELRRQNAQEVYEALLDLHGKAKVNSIWLMIDFKVKKLNQETENKIGPTIEVRYTIGPKKTWTDRFNRI